MKRKNLYFAQLGEAISLANSEIFEYKRISLILFDNIVENLLRSKTTLELQHLLAIRELDKCDFKNIVKKLYYFSNIVTQAKKLELILTGEASIINFCHSSRNKLYHNLFENEAVTEYCILFYSIFLEKYFPQFIEIGITGYSTESEKVSDIIKGKENIIEFKELISKLNTYTYSSNTTPQKILSEILMGFIETIEDFYVSDAKKDWNELNRIVKNQYFYDYEVKKDKNKGLGYSNFIPKFRQKWFDVNQEILTKLKEEIKTTENQNIVLSFEKFKYNNQKIEPIFIGIMLYYSEQEYLASLVED